MQIVPLSIGYIDQVITLCNNIFPDDVNTENPPETGFRASLDKVEYKWFWDKYSCKRIEYYVLLDDNKKVIGTTGIYEKERTSDTGWIGWFCVDPEKRGNGYGSKLLNFTVEKSKEYGYRYLNLYTDPDESPEAKELYKKFGFEFDKVDINPGDKSAGVNFLKKEL